MPDEELEKCIKLELALIHQCEESDIIICHIEVLTDCFKFYENSFGDLMVETAWGHCYGVNDVLQGKKNPCFYALDRDAKGHRVNLNIVEE